MIAAVVLAALAAAQPFVVVGATVEIGDGRVLQDANVVVDAQGRIVDVGPGAQAPAGARVVDGKGKVVTPGLFEPRSNLGLVEVLLEKETNDLRATDEAATPGLRGADGFNPLSARIPVEREEGITSVVVAPEGGLLWGTGHVVDLRGTLDARPDPAAPVAMYGALGRGGAREAGGSRGAALLKLREIFDDARFYLANKARFDAGDARPLALRPAHLAALQPVLDRRVPLVLEADRASDVQDAIRFGVEQRVRVVVLGGAEAWLVARELAAAKVPVVLHAPSTLGSPSTFDRLRARDDAATVLEAAGVEVLFSSGHDLKNHRRLRQEAGIAVAQGFPRAAAVAAITSRPARVFGARDIGVLARGMRADLVVWSGDPLELSTVAEKVFIGGVEQSLDNRQRRLVERYRSRRGG